jgi:tetratricopeptide (TPR) repeat protein
MARGISDILMILAATLVLASPAQAAPAAEKGGSPDVVRKYIADLKKAPDSADLKEKIIRYVQSMKRPPAVPEEYERQTSRGNAFMKMAADAEGYKKAVAEFRDALVLAPWLPEAYLNLADAQEKAGDFASAIQNLNFALLADPNAKNAREIRNRIYELEVFAEEAKQALKASPSVPLPPEPETTVVKKAPPSPKKQEAQEKKPNPKTFVGNWFYKDVAPRGGDEITIPAFTINLNQAGELAAAPPRKTTGATGKVTVFELEGGRVKIQVTWKLANVPSYWKTEDYELKLSDDETKLSGAYKVKSSGSREFSEDKVLFKQ